MKSKLYFTSDWHVGHHNCLSFDNRPYKDLDEMHEALIKNFNYLVPDHGITYFLGDMGLCNNGLLKSVIDRLNGKKILIEGNHDRGMDSMYGAGFDVVLQKGQFSIGETIITMSHCPLKGVYREDTSGMCNSDGTENWHNEDKYADKYAFEDFGQVHLHGHIHSPNGGKSQKILGRQMDVGVIANNYKPVSLSEVQSFINSLKSN